jgi:hypothetical protein
MHHPEGPNNCHKNNLKKCNCYTKIVKKKDIISMRIVVDAVPWPGAKFKHRLTFDIEECSL